MLFQISIIHNDDVHASVCFRAGELAMLTLSRRISCLSTTTRNKAWCLMESSNSLCRQWGNRCQQPSASLDTRGEMDRLVTPVYSPCLVPANSVKWMCLFLDKCVHPIEHHSRPFSLGSLVNSLRDLRFCFRNLRSYTQNIFFSFHICSLLI